MRALLATAVLASLLAGLVTGCGSAGRALSHRELVVVFAPAPTKTDVDRVRAKCDGVAGAKAVSRGKNTAANRRYPLRFDVSGLDLRSRAKLTECLSGDRSVRGYLDSESSSAG